ncbi:methyltransferase domain-containing protein [Allosalinactinospora lopnorensis]|uniref:methyltransferase domain-containing protein n=1 Tax=Allosalinactinospora lopnorensis TaxID=1352348 RepID=UPI000623CD08|nr:methyltransferase domain-containing protein [Allosalinactinospora lopnorensis]
MEFSPAVRRALDAVDEDHYTRHPDGALVTQTTVGWLIASTLDELDVRSGMRVLEIGTGSGYSGALLAELVGEAGTVVSVDVMPDLVDRARERHHSQARSNIELLADDGRKGAPDCGPFDRVVAWATPDVIPQAWVEQAASEALLITPVQVTPLVKTSAVVKARITADGRLSGESLSSGGYVEMHDEVLTQWLVPPRGVDALVRDAEGTPWWFAAAWAADDEHAAETLLRSLQDARPSPRGPLTEREQAQDFVAYLYATCPDGLSVAGLGGSGWRVGYSDARGAALFDRGTRTDTVHVGGQRAPRILREWAEAWRGAGHPGYADMRPALHRVDSGWEVRPTLDMGYRP